MTEKPGICIGMFDTEGKLKVASDLPTGTEATIVSHNFCDSTTWYADSSRVTSGSASYISGSSGLQWQLPHTSIIDMTHGKVFDEDIIKTAVTHQYSLSVYVDGQLKTERTPFATSGGDYVMNYTSGIITFAESQESSTITCSYSYQDGSSAYLTPPAGSYLSIEFAEAQFSKDVVMNGSLTVVVEGYADVFAPELGLPAGTRIPLQTSNYKTIGNIIEEAVGSYPVIPDIGGTLRGVGEEIHGFPFQYRAKKILHSVYGMRINIYIDTHIPYGGKICSLTYYTTTTDEETS